MILLEKIYCSEEKIERANKALKLDGGADYEPRLLAASSNKPTIRIKRLSFSGYNPNSIKLKGASTLQRQLLGQEKIKSEKALKLNGLV